MIQVLKLLEEHHQWIEQINEMLLDAFDEASPGKWLHPYEFYQKLGYSIVGVLPDANGFEKPDIFMAKRVSPI